MSYCETGVVPEAATVSGRGPDSPFEEDIAAAVRQYGLEAHYQVGVAGFFIDIGVVDPREPDQYLLGIECDGATYHTAKSARDRDKIRQQVLENLGWKIYRIWSTDWFKNEQTERRKLRDILTQAQAEANSRFENRSASERGDEELLFETAAAAAEESSEIQPSVQDAPQLFDGEGLKTRLSDLSITLMEEFPDVELEHSLLSDAMIKGLLATRPTTSEEFLQRVPESIRSLIDPDQARIYLSTVLMMIEDSE